MNTQEKSTDAEQKENRQKDFSTSQATQKYPEELQHL